MNVNFEKLCRAPCQLRKIFSFLLLYRLSCSILVFVHGMEVFSRGFNLPKGINISKAQESWFTNCSVVLNNVYILVKKTKNQ